MMSALLAKENGNSIAVLYHNVQNPYKAKYLSYNNIPSLKVYAIVILDFQIWKIQILETIGKYRKDFDNCLQLFRYYGFQPSIEHNWNCDKWLLAKGKEKKKMI